MDFNKELEKEIDNFHKTSNLENYENVINLFPYAILRTPTYLLEDPTINPSGGLLIKKDNTIIFNIIEDSEGQKFIPVFTSEEEYNKMPGLDEASIYHLEFKNIVGIFKLENDISGIAINPADKNFTIDKELIFEIDEALKDI